jgi:hypothetical protein
VRIGRRLQIYDIVSGSADLIANDIVSDRTSASLTPDAT